MPKHLIKRFTPDHNYVRNHKMLRLFGKLFLDPNLWHLNRRSVSGAIFVGVFWAFVPVPGQMFGAIFTAILLRVNVPIAFGLIFLTNPVTIPPTFYATYLLGTWILGTPATVNEIRLSWEWLGSVLHEIWLPLVVGSLLSGIVLGGLGFLAMRAFWRWHVINRYRERRTKRRAPSPPSDPKSEDVQANRPSTS